MAPGVKFELELVMEMSCCFLIVYVKKTAGVRCLRSKRFDYIGGTGVGRSRSKTVETSKRSLK